jgi:hypothetical protein
MQAKEQVGRQNKSFGWKVLRGRKAPPSQPARPSFEPAVGRRKKLVLIIREEPFNIERYDGQKVQPVHYFGKKTKMHWKNSY